MGNKSDAAIVDRIKKKFIDTKNQTVMDATLALMEKREITHEEAVEILANDYNVSINQGGRTEAEIERRWLKKISEYSQ